MATTNIEKESLEAHVELCAERYDRMAERMENLDDRLTGVEQVLKEIKSMLTQKETETYKKMIGIGITLIGTLLTTLLGLIIYIAKHGV
jgi:dsDNA-binding SOS-regulon protein